ncbi:MAG: hypothetical protein R2732_03965 [Microbacteriaceae bacterium]|nr:hypothetical protein [Microbacteriaceae bacterium]HPZ35195.1 hypothetical protein [Microbacteriaceae bacterium]HQC93752.1 hypothetical protein [Microbacteriaceae bacterium]
MSASRFMYFAGERLSIAELSAASLDGHLVGLGEGFMPADAIETIAMRAASLRPLLGDTMAATLLSAAWIWGALDRPPARHSAHRAVEHRLHHVLSRRLVLHDVHLAVEGRMLLGGVWVSTPLHTLIALARAATQGPTRTNGAVPAGATERSTTGSSTTERSAAAVAGAHIASLAAARALVELGLADPDEAVAWLDARTRMPGKHAARALLDALRAHAPAARRTERPGGADRPGRPGRIGQPRARREADTSSA